MWHNILSAGSRWQQLAIMSSYLNVSLLSLFLSIYCLSLSVILSLCISLQRVHSLYVLFLRLPLPLSFFITFLVLCVNPPQQMCFFCCWTKRKPLSRQLQDWEGEKIVQKLGPKNYFATRYGATSSNPLTIHFIEKSSNLTIKEEEWSCR